VPALTELDDWTQIHTDPESWAQLIILPDSIPEKQRLALQTLRDHEEVTLDHQQSGEHVLFRVFGKPTSIPHVEETLNGEELFLQYPVDLEPSYPHYNPQTLFFPNKDGSIENTWTSNGTTYKRRIIGLDRHGRLKQ